MRFENPAMLYLLVLPVLTVGMLFFGIWSRKRIIARFGERRTVEAQLTRPSPYLRAAKGICLVIGVSGLVFAAARPQYGGRIRMLKKSGIDIVVALDFSKSMLAQDTPPSRIERAKLELSEFINQLTGDRIGLVAFAGDTMRFPLTTDYAAATAFWRNLGPYDMPVGGTAIGKALTAATRMLRPENEEENKILSSRSKAIVLITDGEDHFGDPLEVAKAAQEQGIVIHTVGIGSDSPELIPRYLEDGTTMGYQKNQEGEYITTALTKENEETLREIAAATSGRYFKAGRNFSGMAAVIQEIRKMKQSDIESRQQEVYEDVFQWFLIPAFALLLLAFILPECFNGIRRRTPKSALAAGIAFLLVGGGLLFSTPAAAEENGFFMSENSEVKKGNTLLEEGKIGEALESYQAATRALPNRAAVHLNRGLALSRMKDDSQLDQAMQAFKTATDTKGSDAVLGRGHFNLGNAFFKKEDYAEAIRQYKKSLMLSPGNKDAAWNLELAKLKKKEKDEQQKKDQENQDQQDQENQDQQNPDQQDQKNQDDQKQDDQNKQDEQQQEEQKQDEQEKQNEQETKNDQNKQDEQQQEEQSPEEQQPEQPKTKQEVEQMLNSLDNQDDSLQKQMAKQRARGLRGMPAKDW
jgi:Ca-activated chloride channel homolog